MTNSISKIGLGTVQFGIPYGISNKQGQTEESEVSLILNYAREFGINILDTASAYGTSEQVLGKNDLSGFKIVSKFLLHNSKKSISQQLHDSLTYLKSQSLYGYMSHRPMEIVSNPKLWEELIQLKTQGFIKKIGFSFNEIHEVEPVLSLGLIPDIIQVPYNYFDNRFESYMKALNQNGCEIHTRSAFLQGLFFSELNNLNAFFNDAKPIIQELQKYGSSLAGMLLKYCTDKFFIDKVIFGVNTLSQLKNNIKDISVTNKLPLQKISINESILIPSQWPK
ncbi:aldo/keto reductase [Marinilabilia sp.]|uniref:aldo/keto reductase n=1 Tax=Marinilabilia sp. TaxID=2021252 RepID=UPI0025B8966F|nr:aldo/keto reductase [Marinilabilia sp.]